MIVHIFLNYHISFDFIFSVVCQTKVFEFYFQFINLFCMYFQILSDFYKGHSQFKDTKTFFYVFLSEKAMAPHFSTLAWKIQWTEEPGRLQSMGLLRVRHDCEETRRERDTCTPMFIAPLFIIART